MQKNTSTPLVSIVVLNWNGLEDTLQCLESITHQTYQNIETIVVDNGSKPEQKKVLEAIENIIYIDNPVNKGFTGGHIDGYNKAKGDYILLLNNDALLKPDYVEKALEHFDDEATGAVGGRSYFWNEEAEPYDETSQYYTFQNIDVYTGEAFMQSSDNGLPQEVNNVSGSAVVISRKMVEKIGYLHDPFFTYFEETDLFARAKRAGYRVVYDPALRIWHRNGASSGASSGSKFFYYMIFRNRFIFALRNFESRYLWPFIKNYTKVTLQSLLRSMRHPDEAVHGAYVRAALWNLFHIFTSLRDRSRLKKSLGASRYNSQILKEQLGVSIVIDCTNCSTEEIEQMTKESLHDTNPNHEYVLVVPRSNTHYSSSLNENHRYVTTVASTTTHPVNLGCIAARFPWMIVMETSNPVDVNVVHSHIAEAHSRSKRFVITDSSAIVIAKELYEEIGGLSNGLASSEHVTAYASHTKVVYSSSKSQNLPSASRDIKQDAVYNHELLRAAKQGWFAKALQKYYRLFQIVTISKWLFVGSIPLRLKLARIKNLVLFTISLKGKLLATEFKHIRNEVILYDSRNVRKKEQTEIIAKKNSEALDPSKLPVYIICRDRLEPLQQIVSWLESHGLTNIIFIDNDSSYPPLVEFFENTKYQLIRLYRNVGHTSPWRLSLIRSLTPQEFYIVTDPDVIPTESCPSDVIKHLFELHNAHPEYLKVGLGLKIDDLPDYYPLKKEVVEWESQFWKQEISAGVYEAGVDTTFALYKPFTYRYTLHPSLRTGEPYTARHLPWYGNPKDVSEDEAYYRYRANHDVSSWNAGILPERYKKEMKKSA